ncbi:MotE family protein [Rhizosaccharibacter radicis]|uniref:Magnesium transporter MgtE intracellular domain-containing protein n=1 Tax=Rhizosaccharibacter radicis TaxID=2782605 RepID=A0ABT1VZ97_9PROT|nr:hypothetical protein [Acetobacteraceae bacterium KSS12]
MRCGWRGDAMLNRFPGRRLLLFTIVGLMSVLSLRVAGMVREAQALAQPSRNTSPDVPVAVPPGAAAANPDVRHPPAAPRPAATPAVAAEATSRPSDPPKTDAAPASDAEISLLQELRKRRESLDARQKQLDEREALLQALQQKLSSRVDQLASIQDGLARQDADRKRQEQDNWKRLVTVYEDMKPKDAAAIFDVLDIHVLLEVIGRMNERKASAALAAMQPERARLVTQMLAKRRNDAPTASTAIAVQEPG